MPKSKKPKDALPQSFETIDEFVEFWDTHSTADYPEAFREIQEPVHVQQRQHYRVALNVRVGRKLAEQARAKGVTLDNLVNKMLAEQIRQTS